MYSENYESSESAARRQRCLMGHKEKPFAFSMSKNVLGINMESKQDRVLKYIIL